MPSNKKAGGGNKADNNNKKAGGGNKAKQNKQTGWGGNPGALYNELHEFNNSTFNLGEENKPVEPFLTQQDLEEYAEAREQYEEGLKELDRNYETTKHNNEYEEAEIEVGRKQGKESANWDFAGRGLFHSSVRDLDLADIDATAEIKKKFLSDQLSALAVYNEGQKKSMEAKWNRYNEAVDRKKVENAAEVNSTMPRWKVEPHWEQSNSTNVSSQNQKPAQHKPPRKNFDVGRVPNSSNGGIEAPSNNQRNGHGISSGEVASRSRQKAAAGYATGKIAGKIYG